ncbi:MAG: hypothetical protein ACAH11_06255 [Sphingomonas sp.]
MKMRAIVLFLAAFAAMAPGVAAAQTELSPQPTGDWTHTPTGTVFPVTMGDFDRMPVKVFENREMWSLAYSNVKDDLVLTVNFYVYPSRGGSCADETVKVGNQTQMVDGSALVSKGRAASPAGRTANAASYWRHTLPEGTIPGMGELISDSYLFCSPDGKWFVAYRATWEGKGGEDPHDSVTTLLGMIRWPANLQ